MLNYFKMFFKILKAFLILIFIRLSYSNSEILEEINGGSKILNNISRDSSSSCGGKLTATDGTISFKNFSPYSPNERCVWVIRGPNATSYNVFLESIGTSSTLLVSGYGLYGLESHTLPSRATNISVPNSNVLVITFFTSSSNNTYNYRGFSLRYSASIFGDNQKASSTSEDIIASADAGHIKYPTNRAVYGNSELSVIVLTPIFRSQSSFKTTELTYIRNELEGQSCQDRLTVYRFDISSYNSNKWEILGRMCGGVDSELIVSKDIIMIKFESDASNTSTGFHLYSRSLN